MFGAGSADIGVMSSSPAPDTDAGSAPVADAAFWNPDRHVRHEDWIGFLGAEAAEPPEAAEPVRSAGPETDADAPPTATGPSPAVDALALDALLAGTSDDLLPER